MKIKHKVDITSTAGRDLREIFSYISRDSKISAVKWLEEIERQIESLENFPARCSVIPEAQDLGRDYRHLVSGNYRTIFKIEKHRVIIMRVIHGTRLLDMEMLK